MAPRKRHHDEDMYHEGENLSEKGFHVAEEDAYEDEESLNDEEEKWLGSLNTQDIDANSLQDRMEKIRRRAGENDPYEGWTEKQLQEELDRLTGKKNTNPRDIIKHGKSLLTAPPQTDTMLEQHVELALLELKQFSEYLNRVIENIEALRRLHEQGRT